ncbi:hypothetical protein STCU_12188 [Strigomonas culicis]|uniref:Uncharacterized protein n=1 Tax=Strigomonas culicis TaxID=28005 RepID=S9UKR8_9TRYP|nr:hypothetical protein STCU_12188 [Strigomonas culicis]|eukprot:EPY15261.1 hypothetical protein STCU_12188 [Strigomonas culicis]
MAVVHKHVDASALTGSDVDTTQHHPSGSTADPASPGGDTAAPAECVPGEEGPAAAAAASDAALSSTQIQIHTNKHPAPAAGAGQWVLCAPDAAAVAEDAVEKAAPLYRHDATVDACLANIKCVVEWYQRRSAHEAHYLVESMDAMHEMLVSRVNAELKTLQQHISAAAGDG